MPIAAALAGCASAPPPPPPPIYQQPIEISAHLRGGLQAYEQLAMQKAFAGASDGGFGYSFLGDSRASVVRTALANCQKVAYRPCRILDISGEPFQPAYAKFGLDSQQAIAGMAVPPLPAYHFEALDWHVPTASQLRTNAQGYRSPTPLKLDGVTTIATADLARRLKSGDITLIDARGWGDTPPATLPNAHVIDWIGMEEGARRNAKLQANLERVMQLLQPDKTRAVAVFCESAECWMSANAALRLRVAGYQNVLWYRGGMEAWLAARLPTVASVPYATVWSE